MMKKLLLLLSLSSAFALGAEIKNVDYSCGAKDCSLKFEFSSAKQLPNFFQKYDASTHKLTIGFSDTKLALGESFYVLDPNSKGLRDVRVFTDASFKVPLLNFEFTVGPEVHSDKNPVSLSKGKNFVISLPKVKSASWSMRKAFMAKSAAEKKSIADSAKAKVALEKKAKADSVKLAKSEAEAAKKAKADSIAAAKQARLDSIREEKEQSQKKVVSALIEGIRGMVGIQGNGIEQFRIDTDSEINLSMVQNREKSSIIQVSVTGPKKTPMFNVSTSNIVKSVTWMSTGLRIQLQKNVQPMVLVYKGSLILQISHKSKTPGFICYMAKPEGVYVRSWKNPSFTAESFADFSKNMDSDKKQLVTQEDLPYIVADVLKHGAPDDRVKLISYMVSTAYGLKPMASVKLEVNGELYEESAMGDGMYDAFVRAVRHIYRDKLQRKFPWLTNYVVSIPPGGRTDALVQTSISWTYNDKAYRTRGLDADQTEAAIKATIKMLNLIENE